MQLVHMQAKHINRMKINLKKKKRYLVQVNYKMNSPNICCSGYKIKRNQYSERCPYYLGVSHIFHHGEPIVIGCRVA